MYFVFHGVFEGGLGRGCVSVLDCFQYYHILKELFYYGKCRWVLVVCYWFGLFFCYFLWCLYFTCLERVVCIKSYVWFCGYYFYHLFVEVFILVSMCSFTVLGGYEVMLWISVFCLRFRGLFLFLDTMCFRFSKVGVCMLM